MSRVRELLAVAALAAGIFVLADGQPRGSTSKQGADSAAKDASYSKPAPPRSYDHRKAHRGVSPAVRKAAQCKRRPPTAARPVAPIMKEAKRSERPRAKIRAKHRTAAMPSCAIIRREYERMSHGQRMAAYMRATAEQVAHGRRCLQI
jgi:hypothetical protein